MKHFTIHKLALCLVLFGCGGRTVLFLLGPRNAICPEL
uniref:Uncharacterized protein n=1 Tax=Rhizophora mucronata TaxID=61149 RepID=A0A2P2Q537_RHIMU